MRQLLILIMLSISLSLPVFAQNNTGGNGVPNTDGLPDDVPTTEQQTPPTEDPTRTDPATSNKTGLAKRLMKKMIFLKLDHLTKNLITATSANAKSECHEDVVINGYKSLTGYLKDRELKDLANQVSKVNSKECTPRAYACVFKGQALNTFSRLIHDPNFVSYLVEKKKWKEQSAKDVIAYYLRVEEKLKQK